MRLSLQLITNDHYVFNPAEVAKGFAQLEVKDSLSISRIAILVRASIPSPEYVGVEHMVKPYPTQLFKSYRIVFPEPPLEKSTRYTLGRGRHTFNFAVDFSLLSQHAREELRRLKRPRVMTTRWEQTPFFCSVSVVVEGCGRLRRRLCKVIDLEPMLLDRPFIPISPPLPDTPRQASQILPYSTLQMRKRPPPGVDEDGVLPPYTPAIELRAGIKGDCSLLYAGDSLPLRLLIMTPFDPGSSDDIYLKSIGLFLVDPIISGTSSHRMVDLEGTVIQETRVNIRLRARARNEAFEIDPILWEGCEVPKFLPKASPYHMIERPYMLQVVCEFSTPRSQSPVYTSILIPVAIAMTTSPPEYSGIASWLRPWSVGNE